jgi:peptidoglycan/xylan/chitin deacetylase (PgdA/CDA1 family)
VTVTKFIRLQLKSVVLTMLGSDRALAFRLSQIARSDALTILNLHRVDDREGSAYEAMKPALFDELVGWLKQRFRIITFAELETLTPGGKPPLILSFDDGYKDFVDIVAPMLEKHGVRANQNLIPSALDTGLPPMNVQLQDFIGSAPAALLRETPLPGLPGGAEPNNRAAAGMRSSWVFKNRPIAEQKRIFALLQESFRRFDGFRTTPVMSVKEALQIAQTHELGAHSFEHANMAEETDDYLREDARNCLEYFETRLGLRPSVYAFANGSVRSGQAEIVRAAGFQHVLLTGERFSRRSNWLHDRVTMYGKTYAEARFRALGGFKLPSRAKVRAAGRGVD